MSDLPDRPLPLSRQAELTLAEQLAGHYSERIRQRLLPPGSRLPSVREGARRHDVSPHTMVAAYDQLLAQGLVEARRQRGFYVREPRNDTRLAHAGPARHADSPTAEAASHTRPVLADAGTLIRGMLGGARRPGPGTGTLPPGWLDLPLLHAALRRVLTEDRACGDTASALHYGEPAGDRRLRTALAQRIQDFGVRAEPGQIITAVGATQALDLVSRTLLSPGDAVLVDEPGWSVEYARLTQLGMRLLPVPRGPDGPDLEVMSALAREHRPRLYVGVSVLHNPTGSMLDLGCAYRLLQLAEQFDFQ
ncbi:MAG: hypothetical protein RJA44_240, partial [Pseudomonadota bacterium]